MKKLSYFLFFLLFFCTKSTYVFAQSLSTEGKEFYAGFMNIIANPPNNLRFVISSRLGASGTISIPNNPSFQPINFVVAANSTYQSPNIPSSFAADVRETAEQKGFFIQSNTNDISVIAINLSPNRTEASLVLPRTALGNITEYLVNTAQKGANFQSLSEFIVVATEDNTILEITPTANTTLGKTANVPFTITLQRGQVIQYQAVEDLSGTRIRGVNGSCKAFAVFAGANAITLSCAGTGGGGIIGSSQHAYEQLFPTHTWGTEYIATPYFGLNGIWYKILARDGDTKVTISESGISGVTVTPFTLNAASYRLFHAAMPVCIKADKPISVVQMSQNSGCNFPSNADPSLLTLNALNQTTTNATFNTIELSNQGTHYINVVMKTANIAQLRMNNRATDNDNIPLRNYFNTITTCSEYSFAAIPVGLGSRTGIITTSLAAESGFSAAAYGYSSVDMYAYTVGASFENLVTNFTTKIDSAVCNKTTLSFAGIGTNVSNYTWNFGDGSPQTTGQNVKHTYLNSGTYKVTMNVVLFGGTGCSSADAVTKNIAVVVQKPTPLTAQILDNRSPLTVCGSADSLFALAVDSASYQWNLNNLPIKNATQRKLIITQSGSYTVTVSKGDCSSNTSLPVLATFLNVNAKIQGDSVQNFCEKGSLRADVKDSTLYSYEWTRNGEILGNKTATLPLVSGGTYTLTLRQGICKSTSKPVVATINPKYVAEILNLSPIDACDSVLLVGRAVANATYMWTLNGKQIGTNSPNLQAKVSGSYILTVKLGLCSTISKPVNVRITTKPIAKISQKTPIFYCNTAKLTAEKVDSANYFWFRNSVIIADAANKPELTATQAGVYRLLVRVNNCEALSDSVVLTPNRLKATILQNNPVTYCEKGILQADSLNNIGNISYEWALNSKVIGTKPSLTVTESGLYQLKIKQETCEDFTTINVIVSKFPTDLRVQASALNFCPDSLVTLQVNNIANASYEWKHNGKNLADITPKIMVSKVGIYQATVTIDQNCSKTVSTEIKNFAPVPINIKKIDKPFAIKDLTVFPNPTTGLLSFQVSKEISTTLSIENETQWKNIVWSFEGNVWADGNDKGSIFATKAGVYTVKGKDSNGCPQNSSPIEVKAQVLPELTVSMINMLGQVVIDSKQTFKVGETVQIDLSGLSSGMYWLRVRAGAEEKTMKVMKVQP
jgi:hypothetical protein